MEKVTIGVHRRLDQAGFTVRITVEGPDWQRVAKLDAGQDRAEANALALSIKNYADLGLPIIGVFLPDDDQPAMEEASS